MTGYDDPELLVAEWLGQQTGQVTRADPNLPGNWPFTAPIAHVQRGAGEGDNQIALDAALIDVDWYAKNFDHARERAEQTRYLLRVVLPGTTFPSGVLVTMVETVTPPFWAPDPSVARRSATYRIFFAGMLA